jgi:hypothetical protein
MLCHFVIHGTIIFGFDFTSVLKIIGLYRMVVTNTYTCIADTNRVCVKGHCKLYMCINYSMGWRRFLLWTQSVSQACNYVTV